MGYKNMYIMQKRSAMSIHKQSFLIVSFFILVSSSRIEAMLALPTAVRSTSRFLRPLLSISSIKKQKIVRQISSSFAGDRVADGRNDNPARAKFLELYITHFGLPSTNVWGEICKADCGGCSGCSGGGGCASSCGSTEKPKDSQ